MSLNVNPQKKILIVDENESSRNSLQMELNRKGLQTETLNTFSNAANLQSQILMADPDLIIMGVHFRENDKMGIALCEKLRFQGNNAWIILVGQNNAHNNSQIEEKIFSLNAGADDYFTKPFFIDELIAKISTMLRRSSIHTRDGVLEYSDLRMDLINRSVWRTGKQIDLRLKEFDLLKVFLIKPEQILTREYIFDQVWGSSFLGDSNVIEVYIRYLRSKLGKPSLIKTRRGNGYIMISDESQISKANTQFEL